MKVKNQKEVKKDEFRKNKINRHPVYIYAKEGNKFKFIGVTHAEITQGVKNIRLDKNPNPKDDRPAFVRPKTESAKTNNFKSKEKDWKLSKSDKQKIDKIRNKK